MPQPFGPWKIVESHSVYKDAWIDVRIDDVIRPDGKPGTHSVVKIRPGVSVLLLDDEGFVYLTEEFHYGVGRYTLEVVSGALEEGENPREGAAREAQEELGITAREWIPLGSFDPFTTMINSPTRLFLARGLCFGASAPEGTEHIRCVKVSFDEAVAMTMDSRITHGPSCVAILKARLYLEGEKGS
ncbi:MAG TPA: NUDIX hydrolase [Planctomycetaceae bacterium]|nr:NUDIX hydrolase [Planctomycetaceae bacterium]